MLTIIIPTRNRSKRVSDLIESFSNLNQTKFEWEVLVIDNASNDDTKRIYFPNTVLAKQR